ncbi:MULTISPECIES: peptidylprolyl isomerase [Marivita]|uniref:Parvulin-like PPIase n=1 Tax=Marivita cryptomonadis TaxID=505252 RepID=A0A9Q2S4Y3_9RHOB|nr:MULTISPECIES: peptidylprolyl isomerase [Marivita]MBM2321648.1 peptidylprolyl isomerase [Marivita cryptomonadis]MBM2331229.1 peptidylprolyl isomerase [Marivita cryptomonadis]MBM2340815.1 peptidylprolyl isomerase [Marivita cryptomonadis]MBM2345477.1 peptidylprolyl isomerase [Marivita cryptomonadis]MBM2350155.1 peptidylprolyl isomerase [Marivita cryptomonadis]
MTNLITKLSASAFALMLALPVQAQDTLTADSVVATVNGTEITLGHMLMVRASLPDQYQQLPDDVLWDGIMDQIVQQTVLSQQDSGEETRRVRVALENERRALMAAQVIEGLVSSAVTDDAVQEIYEQTYLQAEQAEEFNASHILVESEEEAAAIVDELNGGADFAEVARAKSTGPSGPNGGQLGWFAAGMMVPEFQTAVEELEVGAISGPVQTQFGWHVIILNEKRTKEAPALDAVRGEIENQLSQQAVTQKIDELTNAAEVTRTAKEEVDTSVLSNIGLLEE